MRVLKMIKELQAELMTGKDLPHVVSVRLLARLDEAERHLGFGSAGFDSAQPPEISPVVETAAADNAEEGLEEVK